jgi:hypothetical protein
VSGWFIELFNGSFRDAWLNVNWFLSLEDAREKSQGGLLFPSSVFQAVKANAFKKFDSFRRQV